MISFLSNFNADNADHLWLFSPLLLEVLSWSKLNNKCSQGQPPGTSSKRRLENFENKSWKQKNKKINGSKPFVQILKKEVWVLTKSVCCRWSHPEFWKQGNSFHITSMNLTRLFIAYYCWKHQRNTSQMENQVELCSSLENKLKY